LEEVPKIRAPDFPIWQFCRSLVSSPCKNKSGKVYSYFSNVCSDFAYLIGLDVHLLLQSNHTADYAA
jgi:hypothetical protein